MKDPMPNVQKAGWEAHKHNTKIDLQQISGYGVDWRRSGQDQQLFLVNIERYLWVPRYVSQVLTSKATTSCS